MIRKDEFFTLQLGRVMQQPEGPVRDREEARLVDMLADNKKQRKKFEAGSHTRLQFLLV